MQLTLSTDSIYQGAICHLTASAEHQLSLSTNAKTLAYIKGSSSDTGIVSADDKGKHQIEITLLNSIKEKSTGYSDSGSASRYGMSYFPFISSRFSLEITVSDKLSDITFELPSSFRIIWVSAIATAPSGEKAFLSTSYGEKISTYVFSWLNAQSEGTYTINFDVRTGGPGLLRAAYFPIYYYFIALCAVAAAGAAKELNVLFGATGAAWVFFLRHVNTCDIPRRNVLLFWATFLLAVFLPVWGIAWKLNSYFYSQLDKIIIAIGLTEITIVMTIILAILRAVRLFEEKGVLPKWMNRLWGYFVKRSEERQLKKQG